MSTKDRQIQEPVPFEDFKFSLDFPQDPFLQQSPTLDFAAPSTHAILDEHDQKAFSSFLDAFFMDSDTIPQPSFEHGHLFYHEDNPAALVTHTLPSSSYYEEQRRHSILQSLDEQKKKLQLNHEPQTIYLRSSDTLKSPYTFYSDSKKRRYSFDEDIKRPQSIAPLPVKKQRTTKELLTEEEKKANHIASEQKRRSTIRHGFKELTELIPTLKNVNHSKSVVLFKAAEFIQNLEKRNKHLRHKLESLKLRTQSCSQSPPRMDQRRASSSSSTDSSSGNSHDSSTSASTATTTTLNTQYDLSDPLRDLPIETKKALMMHKTQQEELMLYQEQLQQSSLFRANKLPPILGQYGHKSINDHTLLRDFQDKTIPATMNIL
ncbi:hypothetical protein A0J61_04824 [Choanephora cucurbitarum]|uniref:BHLH domain-containing protein n=1 Tax=Choanephora cucurbitarum TaxID=101091 RepID=A0A1C7NDH8_9FUNG|nr:hypothetical protein A0J61_04824 [Choanephora cucurbitarum]